MTRPSVQVDRLTLQAGALTEPQARRLAELVGLALGRMPALPDAVQAGKVSVEVADQTGRSVAQIADAVAAAIEAALRAEAVR